jgi:hypothetical protein
MYYVFNQKSRRNLICPLNDVFYDHFCRRGCGRGGGGGDDDDDD